MMAPIHERWNEHPCSQLRRLLLNAPSCPSPFGLTDDGLCDFRGIRIEDSLHNLTIERVDFSNAELGHGQFMGTVQACKFVEFSCDGNLGERFSDCDFRKARLSNSVVYGQFVSCDFSNANLTGVRGRNIRFEDCSFEGANLRKASFYDSMFVRCKIRNSKFGSGSLAGSKFEDCEIEGADFSKTVMQRVVGIEKQNI